MTSQQIENDAIDPRLSDLLAELRPTPERDATAAARGRARFLAESESLLAFQEKQGVANPPGSLRERLSMLRLSLAGRTALVMLSVIAVLVLLLGSAGATAYAAQSALPGDSLYSVKTGLEETRANLTGDEARLVEIYLTYAQRRLDEIEKLIAEDRFADISLATNEFQSHIRNALRAMQRLAAGDPIRAAELASQATTELTRYAQVLSGMAASVPETIRPELNSALLASQNTGLFEIKSDGEVEFTGLVEQIEDDYWVIAGQIVRFNSQTEIKNQVALGLLVKVHATRGADGSLLAREIEAVGSPQIEVGNGNANDDQGQISNENRALDENGNDNPALNDNDDGNSNDVNENGDDDSNQNDGEDDNSNGGDDDNGNANDDEGDDGYNDDNGNDGNGDDGGGDDNSNDNEGGGDDNSNDDGGDY